MIFEAYVCEVKRGVRVVKKLEDWGDIICGWPFPDSLSNRKQWPLSNFKFEWVHFS